MALVDGLGFDLNEIKKPGEINGPTPFISFIQSFGLILFFSFVAFVLINFPAYFLIGKYKISPKSVAYEMKVEEKKVASKEVPKVEQYDDNTLFIPKIGVKAKIQWSVPQEEIMDSLDNGLVHINGSAKPNEGKNIFITGHSSNYWWKEGDYNTVFALLPELKENDELIVTYKGEFNKYKVRSSLEVSKKDVGEYTASGKEQLTLMTCIPVGTNLKRLLIFADPI